MIAWYEKWCKKNQEEAKGDYVTISRLEFLDTISSTIASLDADLEEAHSLSIFGAIVAEKIFDKQETNEGKNEKADDRRVCKGNAEQKGEVMTNGEKNKKRFDELGIGDLPASEIARHIKEGTTGTVRMIRCAKNGTKFYGVRFDGESCGYAFLEHEIEKVKSKKTPPRIVVYREGDTVTVKDLETGETASAVCSKDDTFDFHTGAFIAMARLTHFMDDIRMMRLEAEQIEGDIADMQMRFGALMGEGYKYPEGFFREEEE